MDGLWVQWMLLLLQLHLGISAPLPAPSNVSISSFNMEHTLSFLPGPETPPGTFFAVEVLRYSKNSWRKVIGCSKMTAGQTCNLTRAFKDEFSHYQARVNAFTTNQRSNWTTSALFLPLSDTVVGPPDMSVSGCGNCLLVQLRSTSVLHDLHGALVVHVQRTRDGAQFKLSLEYKDEIVITYLEPGVEYCMTITVKTRFNAKAVPSKPHCAFTSPPLTNSSLSVVYSLLAFFCAVGFLLFGLVACNSHLGLWLRRRRLARALAYSLLRGQKNCGSGPFDRSGQTSALQQHKEGSADCLLTPHRPDRRPRCSSEDGGEKDRGL